MLYLRQPGKVLLLLFCLVPALRATAQNIKPFEFEVALGFNQGMKYQGVNADLGTMLVFEPRFNIPNSAIDVGIQSSLGYIAYQREEADYIHFNTFAIFCDYNWRNWKRMSLFAGFGLGLDNRLSSPDLDSGFTVSGQSALTVPRIGAEFFQHIRISAEYGLKIQAYSYLGLTVGVVFGGGYKK